MQLRKKNLKKRTRHINLNVLHGYKYLTKETNMVSKREDSLFEFVKKIVSLRSLLSMQE